MTRLIFSLLVEYPNLLWSSYRMNLGLCYVENIMIALVIVFFLLVDYRE